jgi:hypothetical protein
MITQEIIMMLNNHITYQTQQREQAVQRGDIAMVNLLDVVIAEAQATLAKLQA